MLLSPRTAALGVLAGLVVPGCGGDAGSEPDLLVSAAASLKTAFTAYGEQIEGARPRFGFSGSDQLAAQIRAGARPDVFAAASSRLPRALYAEKLVERPVAFARNRLVIAVASGDRRIAAVGDLARPGTKLALGSPTVPVGDYTRAVLARLPARVRRGILGRVRSSEPDAAGIVGKVLAGGVDAGVVYRTDVIAARGRLRAIELPPGLRPDVVYEAAVVRGARHPREARAFVSGLNAPNGRAALAAAGFSAPP